MADQAKDIKEIAFIENIKDVLIEGEMQTSYLDYAMSVIVGRAIPDVRDGLKPVHRRILFAMNDLGMHHNKPYKKAARIVGEVLGKYHPHGDMAVYDSLVRMAQNFSLRYPLVDGQGNFGSVDGDNAASMRYTEARLAKISDELLIDIDKETVDFAPNFDATLDEPIVLPSKIPNLLINGSSGIAVGMATNIPPHNISEIIDGEMYLIDNPDCSITDVMKFVKGPDFPTHGIIAGTFGIKEAYMTGRGKITVKSKAEITTHKDHERIIITEIPFQLDKSILIEQIALLITEKKILGISDLRDESDRDGMRIVIELKKDANPNVVLNQLYKFTRLTCTFGINMLVLDEGSPKTLNLKQMIQKHISHRQVVVRKRTQFELKKAAEKAHILEGLIIALNHIDEIIQKIKKSKDTAIAQEMLMSDYKLSELQAKSILDMKLHRLSSLEQQKIRDEHKSLLELINDLNSILASEQKILDIIKKELMDIKQKYGDKRKTVIEEAENDDIIVEDLIEKEQMAVTISHQGYIKRTHVDKYKAQARGGKGIIAATSKEDDFIEQLFVSSTHDYILFFSNMGKVYWQKVYGLPEADRTAKGKAIVNLLPLEKDEKITALIPVAKFEEGFNLVLCTKNGTVKKTPLVEYSRPRQGGIIAITLDEGDDLVNALLTDGTKQILIATRDGMAVKFHEEDARPIGRTSKGVRGISLKDNDQVIGMVAARDEDTILTICENGHGKRSPVSDYRLINRGGSGVINIKTTDRNGNVVAIIPVTDEDQVMLISQNGIAIRTPCKGISIIGRNTQGLRLMKMDEGDKVVAAAKVVVEEVAQEEVK